MKNYREKHQILTNKTVELKEQKENLRKQLEEKETEYDTIKKENDLEKIEYEELRQKRIIIISSRNKKINRLYMLLLMISTVAVILSSYTLVKTIFLHSEQVLIQLLGIYGVIVAGATMEFGVVLGLKELTTKIKRVFYRKNINKPECMELTIKMQEKAHEISRNDEKQSKLLMEINEIKDDIIDKNELLIFATKELSALEKEIIDSVLNNSVSELEESKSYTRVKVKEE